MKHLTWLSSPLLLALALPLGVLAADGESTADSTAIAEPTIVPVAAWLRLGPWAAPLPAFNDSKDKGFDVEDLLAQQSLDPRRLLPRADLWVASPGGDSRPWQVVNPPDGLSRLAPPAAGPGEAYLALYLETSRWLSVTVRLQTPHPVAAFLDGETVTLEEKKDNGEEAGTAGPMHTGTLKLTRGTHLLLVHTVYDPERDEPWLLDGGLSLAADIPPATLVQTLEPQRAVNIHDILDAPRFDEVAVSPDGKLAALRLGAHGVDGEREHWLEIRRLNDGGLVQSWRGGNNASSFQWAPRGHAFSYTTTDDGRTSLWLHTLAEGSKGGDTRRLLDGVEHFLGYEWAPDGSFLVYSFNVEAEPDERNVKRVKHPADRQPGWRNRSYLVQVSIPDGARRRLTAGPLSTTGWHISPASDRLLLFRSEPDIQQRPYSTTELWELDLASLAARKILDDPWIGDAVYGPDPNVIAVTGSPSAFDGMGLDLPAGTQPNDYGGQLYLYNLQDRRAEPVSRDFDPAIQSIHWSRADGLIHAECVDGQFRRLYTYSPRDEKWSLVETGLEHVAGVDHALDARVAVAYGTSITTPHQAMVLDLKRNRARLLSDPGAERYRDVTFGRTELWPCTLPDGQTLDGRIYYPRDFDPQRKYPVIVYYYGGTSPVTVDYGGRYPKNVWAGQGYVVYVPQPSGAIGYGQEFAARHVNDWGKLTAQEVIDGTRAFLAAHPWADAEHVGCIGASYGGFLTMYLVSQTDIFAAAISHAGISSISSYWGEGFWGYAYGARALAHSFPWSHRDLYIGQSPLYHADKINTPLLLLHGADDTNVPLGESTSLFTALKLLGRQVEYVRIEGQNHWILEHDRRIVWNDTILAFFAKYLEGRSEWWEDLYPGAR